MSDDEEQFNPKVHKRLLQAISSLGPAQHIRNSTRNEPQRQQDEFQLVKPVDETVKRHPVGLRDIVKVLTATKKHVDTAKELKVVQSKKMVLDKPLEKPQADRMKRRMGYEDTKKRLERWDAIVARNRNAEIQVFPLPSETIYLDTSSYRKPFKRALKSDLAQELEAEQARLKNAKRALTGDNENEEELAKLEEYQLKKKLTRDELVARHKELLYLKIRESQKSAKARMQNKIKSKKYHKLLKRQRTQEQIKQFEMLQKNDPKAALEKLNALEKSRVMERASLRHKNTGSWAKNLQIRAKYDKDVRKDLADQLQINRQLTQKTNDTDDDDDMESGVKSTEVAIVKEALEADPFNPWTRAGCGGTQENLGSITGEDKNWRKYWLERNENEKMLIKYKKSLGGFGMEPLSEMEQQAKDTGLEGKDGVEYGGVSKYDDANLDRTKRGSKIISQKVKNETISSAEKRAKQIMKQSPIIKAEKKRSTDVWIVEKINKTVSTNEPNSKRNNNIDDIFDKQEYKIKQKLNNKLKALSKKAKNLKNAQQKNKKQIYARKNYELKNLKDLSFKSLVKYPMIDEELITDDINSNTETVETNFKNAVEKAATNTTFGKFNANENEIVSPIDTATIDPHKLADVKLKQHVTNFIGLNETIGIGDEIDMSDEDDVNNVEQQVTIGEAFEDDDIVADFTRDKTKETELKNTEIDLSLPGWGSWAGAGISAEEQSANSNKRLIIKLTKEEKRRDDNKGGLYINEAVNKDLRRHLVSDMPFPFTSVADYESSIRAPIGRNCVPETAFRMIVRPAVIALKGQIIEPMDDSELIKPPQKFPNVVDTRIARLEQKRRRKKN